MFNELLKNVMNLGIITEDDVKRLTAIELLMLIIERTNGLLNHVEIIDLKLDNLLEDIKTTTIEVLNKWTQDGTMDELINQSALAQVNAELSKVNNKLTGLEFNLREFGEIKENEDIAPILNQAIDYISNKFRKGAIVIPGGNYLIGETITLKHNISLKGQGMFITHLKLKDEANCQMIRKTQDSAYNVVSDMYLNGNKENQTGSYDVIHFSDNNTVNDNYIHLVNLFIYKASGNGIYIDWYSKESRILNCMCRMSGLYGMYLKTTDSIVSNCTFSTNDRGGIRIEGSNNRIIGVKSFGNTECGFHFVNGRFNYITSCEVQENGEHGVLIDETSHSNIFSSLGIGSDSTKNGNYAGLYLQGSDNIIDFQVLHSYKIKTQIKHTLTIRNTAKDNRVSGSIRVTNDINNVYVSHITPDSNIHPSNIITINNIPYNNKSEIELDFNSPSEIVLPFSGELKPGTSNFIVICDALNRVQSIKTGNITDDYGGYVLSKTIPVKEGYDELYSTVKADTGNGYLNIAYSFYNEAGDRIAIVYRTDRTKLSNEYLQHTVAIPDGSKKVKIELDFNGNIGDSIDAKLYNFICYFKKI